MPFILPLTATLASIGGQYAANAATKRKRPKSTLAEHAQAMAEANAQTANQNTANTAAFLSPAIAKRGLTNSGYAVQALGDIASRNAQEATRQTAIGANQLRLADIQRNDEYDREQADRNRATLSGIAETTAQNLAGFANLQEVERQQAELLSTIKELYASYGEEAPKLYPQVFQEYRRIRGLTAGQRGPLSLDQIQQY